MEDLTIEDTEEEDETMAITAQEGLENSNFQGSISNKKLVQKDYRSYSFVNYYIQKNLKHHQESKEKHGQQKGWKEN